MPEKPRRKCTSVTKKQKQKPTSDTSEWSFAIVIIRCINHVGSHAADAGLPYLIFLQLICIGFCKVYEYIKKGCSIKTKKKKKRFKQFHPI